MPNEVPFPLNMSSPNDTMLPVSIYAVRNVETTLQKSLPPILVIRANGDVPTGGYREPTLVPRVYVTPPADGIWDFDFVVVPPAPGSIVTQGFEEKSACFAWNDPPDYLRGVRVRAQTNAVESLFSEADGQNASSSGSASGATTDLSALRVSVKVPDTIWINKQPGIPPNLPVSVKVEIALSNGSAETQLLYAPTPCDIFNWQIETESGEVVQREPTVFCIQVPQYREIGSRQVISHSESIVLNGHEFSTGDYVLRVQFWGVEGTAELSVQEAV